MEQWEYKIKEIVMKDETVKKQNFWGGGETLMPQNVRWDKNKMITESIGGIKNFEDQFDRLGIEGWELCETVPIIRREGANPGGSNTEKIYFIFKRKTE